MQLGISSYTYGWGVGIPGSTPEMPITAAVLLDRAKSFDLKLVQFGDNLPIHLLSANALDKLKKGAKTNEIEIEIGARGLTPDHLQLYIRLAKNLDSKLLRFVIDQPGYEPDLNEIITIIRNHIPLLEEHNVTLGIENHDRLLAREFARIMEAVGNDHVGICLDSVNSMGAGEGLKEIVRILAPYTVNLHIKDFGIQRLPHLMGFQIDGRPAGKGMLNIPNLLPRIQSFNRCRTAVLEQWVPPESDLLTTIEKEKTWAEESISYLKPFFDKIQ